MEDSNSMNGRIGVFATVRSSKDPVGSCWYNWCEIGFTGSRDISRNLENAKTGKSEAEDKHLQ